MGIRITPDVTTLVADSNTPLSGNVQLVSGTNVTLSQSGQAITVTATPSSGPPITVNDEGTFTVATTGRLLQPNRLTLSGTERSTLAGTGRAVIADVLNYEPSKGVTNTGPFNILDTEYQTQFKRLTLAGNARLTETGTGREVLFDLGFTGVVNAYTTDGTTMTLVSPKIITNIKDVNANTILGINPTAGAVNDITISNSSASTVGGTIGVEGTGTDLDIALTPKGAGNVRATTGSFGVDAQFAGLKYTRGGGNPSIFFDDGGNIRLRNASGQDFFWIRSTTGLLEIGNNYGYGWSPNANDASATPDLMLSRNAANVLEVNTGTGGQFADIKARNLSLTGTGPAPITRNDYPLGFTVPDSGLLQQPNRATLSGTERATLAGTGRDAISDQGPTNTPLSKVTLNPTSFIIRAGEYVMQYLRLALAGNTRATLTENARIVNFEFRPPSHLVLAGAGL